MNEQQHHLDNDHKDTRFKSIIRRSFPPSKRKKNSNHVNGRFLSVPKYLEFRYLSFIEQNANCNIYTDSKFRIALFFALPVPPRLVIPWRASRWLHALPEQEQIFSFRTINFLKGTESPS
jgi:hypothetical protein